MFGFGKSKQTSQTAQAQNTTPLTKSDKDSVQAYLDIAEIRDNVVVLKDGGLRAVLLVSSVNFALKSEDEQKALIGGYQNFLNSLEFPVQVVIQSRPLDLNSYISKLKEVSDKQPNELLRIQTIDYIEYIQQLLDVANIMTKRFFVIVPYTSVNIPRGGFIEKILETVNPLRKTQRAISRFDRDRTQLFQRVDIVASGLRGMGLQTVLLNTQELIELFYEIYNPDLALKRKLPAIEDLSLLRQKKA